MAVKIRLSRRGRKKLAMFDVIVTDAKAPRDGAFIEKLGIYNPNSNPATIQIDETKALDWLMKGAQPSDTVRAMLSYKGVLIRKHLQVGVLKGAITQEEADKRFEAWKQNKDTRISTKVDSLTRQKENTLKAKLEAETKIKEARAAALREKQEAAIREQQAAQAAEAPPAPVAEIIPQETAPEAPAGTAETTTPPAE